jgi:hypothetical protein
VQDSGVPHIPAKKGVNDAIAEGGALSTRLLLVALISLNCGTSLVAASTLPIPDTPAGHALGAWLDAFNSGDRARFESFEEAHAPWLTLDTEMAQRARTGGYDLLSIVKSTKLWIVFRTKERASSAEIYGRLVVRSYDPDHITLLSLVPAGVTSPEFTLDEAERTRVVDGAAKLLERFYLFPDAAKRVSEKLRKLQDRGEYRGITDPEIFSIRLGDDLVMVSGDKHIGVDYFPKAMPPEQPPPRPHPDPLQLAAVNCGFERAEHYPPNIGYLKLTMIAEPESCVRTATAAMTFLADSDSLIIDLRQTGGGSPRMVAVICSYLFGESVHLDDVEDHQENVTEQLWTVPYLPGKKFTGKPVWVLISRRTFSASEELAYDLKSLKRATLIGETTGGGAHVIAPHRIDEHFFIRVPFGRFVNPITKTDWEGTGVEPDIKVSAANALDEALRRAREQTAGAQSAR